MRGLLPIFLSVLAWPVIAQDLSFDATATEDCLSNAADMPSRLACVGASAEACIATPDGYTTVGMGFCYSEEAAYWDERLNTAFASLRAGERDLMKEMKDIGATVPDTAIALRDMQRAWIVSRDASCNYEYSTWGGGTGGGPAVAACLMHETARQTLKLEERLMDRFE